MSQVSVEKKDKNMTILLVDRHSIVRLPLQWMLEEHGYQVNAAENGLEALAILADKTPDVIICDTSMPEMDGYELVRKIKQDSRTTNIPVLFLSAQSAIDDQLKGLSQGADSYLTQKIEIEELINNIESLIQKTPHEREIEHLKQIISLQKEKIQQLEGVGSKS